MPAVQLYSGLCYLYLGIHPRNRGRAIGGCWLSAYSSIMQQCWLLQLPKVSADVRPKWMHDLMQYPHCRLPRKEDVFLQFLYILIYWRCTLSYLEAFIGKAGGLKNLHHLFKWREMKHKNKPKSIFSEEISACHVQALVYSVGWEMSC